MGQACPQIGHLKNIAAFRARLVELGLELPVDDSIFSAADGSPLATPLNVGGFTIGNRWTIHPMEGWDGTADGRPSAHTLRRWRRFGESGAKLIWGGEACAVQQDGRANPNQLCYRPENESAMRALRNALVEAHKQRFGAGADDDLLVGLQLTHSGRFSRPNERARPQPRIVYHHPLLDARVGIDPADDSAVLTDGEIHAVIGAFIEAAKMAQRIGFQFVDVKHCHGYLGHEFLSAFDRPGRYGGDFTGRTRFLREICQGIGAECPGLMIGVRLSVFDMPPFHPDAAHSRPGRLGPGTPEEWTAIHGGAYPGFGCRRDDPLTIDLEQPVRLLKLMRDAWGVGMVNLSAGSPYYNPHIQRPAYYPPSDGYQPPEDPLVGCVRQIQAVREIRRRVTGLPLIGTAYTYFQQFLPHVAQAVVREGWVDSVGLGRMVLAYPDLPADCLEHGELRKAKRLCRTFSDCTTAPRNGIISGCYPLDEYYKDSPQAEALRGAKWALRERLRVLRE